HQQVVPAVAIEVTGVAFEEAVPGERVHLRLQLRIAYGAVRRRIAAHATIDYGTIFAAVVILSALEQPHVLIAAPPGGRRPLIVSGARSRAWRGVDTRRHRSRRIDE